MTVRIINSVKVNGWFSDYIEIKYGLPQRTILSPLLFIIQTVSSIVPDIIRLNLRYCTQIVHFIMVCRNFNTKTESPEIVLVNHGTPGRNERGDKLLHILLERNIQLTSSFFYKVTIDISRESENISIIADQNYV